jgi:hypothetical protein
MGRPAPTFWWDMVDNATAVIVQSDWPGGQELARFKPAESQPASVGLVPQIDQAESLISDFKAGRQTPRTNNERLRQLITQSSLSQPNTGSTIDGYAALDQRERNMAQQFGMPLWRLVVPALEREISARGMAFVPMDSKLATAPYS